MTDEIKKCSICGKPYKKHEIKIGGKIFNPIYIATCDCEALRQQEEERQREEQRRRDRIEQKTNELKHQLNCPLMTPLFQEKSFEKILRLKNVIGWSSDYEQNFNKCLEYAQKYETNSGGLFMIGGVGTGKTTLQACVIKELERKGKFCLLIQFSTLLDLMIQACSFDAKVSIFQLYNTLSKFDYVVLDDIGREKYTDKRLEIAFRVIDCLMNNKVTVSITTNPECFQKLTTIPEYKAIVDRLRDLCLYELTFKNKSFRGQNVKIF